MPAHPRNRTGLQFGGPYRYDTRGLGITFDAGEPEYQGKEEPPHPAEAQCIEDGVVALLKRVRDQIAARHEFRKHPKKYRPWRPERAVPVVSKSGKVIRVIT